MLNDKPVGFVKNEVYKVEQFGSHLKLVDVNGNKVTSVKITTGVRKSAFTHNMALQAYNTKSGRTTYRKVPMTTYNNLVSPIVTETAEVQVENPTSHSEIREFIHNQSIELKPRGLVINDLKWKYLVRSAVRGRNIMMVGPTGTGKTLAARSLVTSLSRPDYYFNLGSTQDPRATLIGNTHFDKSRGTFFSESTFVRAIQTPNAIILLDELTRAHPDAWNILMTVLDYGQRYLRLDEAEGSPIVKVADGVTFIATANMGSEYTSTRVLDRAMMDRFTVIEMDLLTNIEELNLLQYMFPDVSVDDLISVSEIAHHTRVQSKSDAGKITSMVSTRASVEMAGLLWDGFSLVEAAEIAILPFFSDDGGIDSERTYMRQLVQKYVKTTDDELYTGFNTTPVDDTNSNIRW
jgi:nitric oxide reductase NorQ protein